MNCMFLYLIIIRQIFPGFLFQFQQFIRNTVLYFFKRYICLSNVIKRSNLTKKYTF